MTQRREWGVHCKGNIDWTIHKYGAQTDWVENIIEKGVRKLVSLYLCCSLLIVYCTRFYNIIGNI